ncbi:glycosyltransferase [Fictibacillus enclensis]|uniref:glycosyltransferase family 2 protein n=1 Tax=Fictibacillus enclensis TaxID=1017270 RepID=UPI0025A2A6F4|nr:glycosyltransferase [Fictibacillus enclensis]MDM5335843.1 glycosyltransferase [Fictibacillus enclensis]
MYELTVIIPVYNQAYPLALTLDGFVQQTLSKDCFQLIIIDDGSTEPIGSVVEAYKDRLNIKLYVTPNQGRAVARNIGISHVEKGLLVFCDADRIPRSRFLEEHLNTHLAHPASVVIGQVREMYVSQAEQRREYITSHLYSNQFCKIPQYCNLVYSLYNDDGSTMANCPWISSFSGNMSLDKALIDKVGKFDEEFTHWGFEHFELGYRLHKNGFPFIYQREATNVHLAHSRDAHSYKTALKNSHRYFVKKHPDSTVQSLLAFMLGTLSLYELEAIESSGTQNRIPFPVKNPFVKITNF